MSEIFYGLALLACPAAMGAMMWFMMRGGRSNDPATANTADDELRRMRTEIDRLRAAETGRPAEG